MSPTEALHLGQKCLLSLQKGRAHGSQKHKGVRTQQILPQTRVPWPISFFFMVFSIFSPHTGHFISLPLRGKGVSGLYSSSSDISYTSSLNGPLLRFSSV